MTFKVTTQTCFHGNYVGLQYENVSCYGYWETDNGLFSAVVAP